MGIFNDIGTLFKDLITKSSIGGNVFFPIYDPSISKDRKLGLDTLVKFIQDELGLQGREIYELPNVTNTLNVYSSSMPLTSYVTEGLYIVKFNVDSDPSGLTPTFNTNGLPALPVKAYDPDTNSLIAAKIKSAVTYVLLYRTDHWEAAFSSGVTGTSKFTRDFVVSLSNGKTLGKILNGQTAYMNGKSLQEGIEYLGIEDIYPTYTPATLVLSDNQADFGEVGESLSDTLTAVYTQNDAGSLTSIKIQRDGVDLTPNGTTSPFTKTNSIVRINGNISYRAFVNYNAGNLKNISPSGLPDDRAAAIRDPNRPQAAENNFGSNIVTIGGGYKKFFGVGTIVTNSTQVRALANNTYNNTFSIVIPAGQTKVSFAYIATIADITDSSVKYVEGFNSNVGNTFTKTTFNVSDAGSGSSLYKIYTVTFPAPLSDTATYNVTLS